MPHIWNNILVVTKEELIPTFWNTLNTLQSEIQRYKDKSYGIKQVCRGGNGRQMLISFESLPNEIQEALGDPRRISNPLEIYYQTDMDAVSYYKNFKRIDKYLKSDEQERYIVNASVLQAVIELETERVRMRKSTRGVMQSLFTDVINFNDVLKKKHKQEHNLPKNLQRFSQTYRAFKESSYFSLIKDPTGKGKQNARKVDKDTEIILNSLFSNIKHKPNPTEIFRYYDAFLSGYTEVYNTETGEIYDPKSFKKLSESTITLYLSKWENKIATHKIRSGNRQIYMGKYKPHRQMSQPKFSGSLLSIDDRQPPFAYEPGKRVWFYNGVDLASGCITVWVYGKTKEGIITEFYRQLLRNYSEWGLNLPFGLEAESSLNSSFKNTFLKSGVMFQNVSILANNARGKRIERLNKVLRYEIEKKRDGWIARPNARLESNQTGKEAAPVIPYDRIIEECLQDIEYLNNLPSPLDPSKTRWEYFLENQEPNLQPINWISILPHLGYLQKSSCRGGYILLQGMKRALAENGNILTGDLLIEKMTQIEGKELDIYWLDDNEGKVLKALAFHHGRLVCEIMEMPKYNRAVNERTVEDIEAKKLQDSYVKTVEIFEKSKRKTLQPLNIIDNSPKTLNTKFKINQLRKQEINKPTGVEIPIEPELEDYQPHQSQSTVRSWKSNF